MQNINEWRVSGKVYYLKEMDGEFTASLKIRGTAQRQGEVSSQILEMGCWMQSRVYEQAKVKGLRLYKEVSLSGHMETWHQSVTGKPADRVMFIVDRVLEVA